MKMLKIAALREGFRRAGVAHTTAPQEFPADRFTAEQIEALRREPMLVVVDMDAPDPEPKGEGKPPAKPPKG